MNHAVWLTVCCFEISFYFIVTSTNFNQSCFQTNFICNLNIEFIYSCALMNISVFILFTGEKKTYISVNLSGKNVFEFFFPFAYHNNNDNNNMQKKKKKRMRYGGFYARSVCGRARIHETVTLSITNYPPHVIPLETSLFKIYSTFVRCFRHYGIHTEYNV